MGRNSRLVTDGIAEVTPLLVIPIAVCSAFKLCYHAARENLWVELAPLILIQLNTIFMWTCKGYLVFDRKIADQDWSIFKD